MDQDLKRKLFEQHRDRPNCPSPAQVQHFFKNLLGTLFADFTDERYESMEEFEAHCQDLRTELTFLICGDHAPTSAQKEIVDKFFDDLDEIYDRLNMDLEALEKGDPAARSRAEVIRTYPGFYAIAAHRLAHQLHLQDVAIIPRILSEHAHSHTGIDIHPGATIGDYFCIDHGTGIVIGETSNIGNWVKIYQGVTLGALSVRKEDAALKRHPTIEDRVVLYAGATILGGNTVIGHDSVIGGNVWITKSIRPHSKVYYQARMHDNDTEEMDLFIYKTDN